MKLTQKTYEKRVNSGLQPFSQYKPSKKYVPFIQSRPPVDSPRSFLDFLKYFLFVFVIIVGLAAFFHFLPERDLWIARALRFDLVKLLPESAEAFPQSAAGLPAKVLPRGYSSDSSNNSSDNDKTVSVDGYYRKNGTYVAPHERSAPRSHK